MHNNDHEWEMNEWKEEKALLLVVEKFVCKIHILQMKAKQMQIFVNFAHFVCVFRFAF